MKKTNLFIVGAPRCGTTALCEYLQGHPNIFIARLKQIHYFTDDFPKYRMVDTLEDYLKLFQDSTGKHKIIGEDSTLYLYSQAAIRKIYAFNPKARLIVMLRNPVDMVRSFHSRQYYSAVEDVKDFKTAWELEPERMKGRHIPKHCLDIKMLQYSQVARFGSQVERLLKIFPLSQVKFIISDDFKESAKAVYEDVLSFLEVPSDGREDFSRINVNVEHRFDRLGAFIAKPPRLLTYMAEKYRKLFGLEKISLAGKLHRLNSRKKGYQPLDPELRSQLIKEFEGEVGKLSRILNRDLSSWTQVAEKLR